MASNKFLKVFGTCLRVLQLAPTALRLRPDVAISHGSRAQLMICKLLRIPTIMMHDYEHSTKTGFLEPDWFLMPDVIPNGAMARQTDTCELSRAEGRCLRAALSSRPFDLLAIGHFHAMIWW